MDKINGVFFSAEIVERGIRNHPELGIGAQAETEGGARSVGNPPSLALSGLAQSLNLKAAIEYQEGNCTGHRALLACSELSSHVRSQFSVEGAREALIDLPPRSEPELDPVTLHNLSLTDTSGTGTGLRRLAFLLELGPPTCPPETFANILLLCCKHEMYDTAADMLAEHAHLTYKYLSPVCFDQFSPDLCVFATEFCVLILIFSTCTICSMPLSPFKRRQRMLKRS